MSIPPFPTQRATSSKLPKLPSPCQTTPVFVGYTELAPAQQGVQRVDTWEDYLAQFGGAFSSVQIDVSNGVVDVKQGISLDLRMFRYQLYYAVKQFFKCYGQGCYVLSVGEYVKGGGTQLNFQAYLNALPFLGEVDGIDLIILPDLTHVSPQGDYLQKEANYYSVVNAYLAHTAQRGDRTLLFDMIENKDWSAQTAVSNALSALNSRIKKPHGLGVATYPEIQAGMDLEYDPDSVIFSEPGGAWDGLSLTQVEELAAGNPQSSFAVALRANWRKGLENGIARLPINMAASVCLGLHLYCNDRAFGTWATSKYLNFMREKWVGQKMTEMEQGQIQDNSLGVVPLLTTNDNIALGSFRNIQNETADCPYFPEERTMAYLKSSLKMAMVKAMEESLNEGAVEYAQMLMEDQLFQLWRAGGLIGSTSQEAYHVECEVGNTMTQTDLNEGRLIANISVALKKANEFQTFSITYESRK